MSKKIDHEFTLEIVCPHCGYEFGDSWQEGDGEDIGEIECESCSEPFYAERIITIDYSTRKLDE